MEKGDLCFFCHSSVGNDIVGIVEVIKEHHLAQPDQRGRVVAGGVASYQNISNLLINLCQQHNYHSIFPPIVLCVDNAAMIAIVGLEKLKLKELSQLDHPANPRWPLDENAAFLKRA